MLDLHLRLECAWHAAKARAALRGKELLYLADPVDAMVLHIQGSGLVNVTEPDGRQRWVRMAYAATNDQPYKSIGRWLLDRRLITDASWPGIKAWIDRNPSRVKELLWQNPRVVFFREEAVPVGSVPPGPKGAQGVPLDRGGPPQHPLRHPGVDEVDRTANVF
jgi:membrane-bound lytic murein transglycosylase A